MTNNSFSSFTNKITIGANVAMARDSFCRITFLANLGVESVHDVGFMQAYNRNGKMAGTYTSRPFFLWGHRP
jgi:hypothetical protein